MWDIWRGGITRASGRGHEVRRGAREVRELGGVVMGVELRVGFAALGSWGGDSLLGLAVGIGVGSSST